MRSSKYYLKKEEIKNDHISSCDHCDERGLKISGTGKSGKMAKSRNPRLALARLPPIAFECVKNLHRLYLGYYLHSVKKLDLKSIFVAQPSTIIEIVRGSHRLDWPAAQQNVTSLYSYVAETCIYHILQDLAFI